MFQTELNYHFCLYFLCCSCKYISLLTEGTTAKINISAYKAGDPVNILFCLLIVKINNLDLNEQVHAMQLKKIRGTCIMRLSSFKNNS